MSTSILNDLERLQADTGLSEHRIGILVANNGRLFERIRGGSRMWPETVEKVRDGIVKVRNERASQTSGGAA